MEGNNKQKMGYDIKRRYVYINTLLTLCLQLGRVLVVILITSLRARGERQTGTVLALIMITAVSMI